MTRKKIEMPRPYTPDGNLPDKITIDSTIKLADGNDMPFFGIGTYELSRQDAYDSCVAALENKYTLIDTACLYQNEYECAKAVEDAADGRKIFMTTKLIHRDHGKSLTANAVALSQVYCSGLRPDRSGEVDAGKLRQIDLYLMHSPYGSKLVETWDSMLEAQAAGRCKSLGVSNFGIQHLEALRNAGRPLPQVNQIELHPFIWKERKELLEYCQRHKIAITAYGSMLYGRKDGFLDHPTIVDIAKRHNKSAQQVLLRWGMQMGFAVIPRSKKATRVVDNANVFDFTLSEGDMSALCDIKHERGKTLAAYWNPVEDCNDFDLGKFEK